MLAIRVRTLDQRSHELSVEPDVSIRTLKERIHGLTEVPGERQRLIYRGRVMADEDALSEYRVEDGHTIHMVARPADYRPRAASVDTVDRPPASEDGARRLLAGALDFDTARLVSDALGFGRLTGFGGLGLSAPVLGTARPTDGASLEHVRQGLLTLHTLLSTMEETAASVETARTTVRLAGDRDRSRAPAPDAPDAPDAAPREGDECDGEAKTDGRTTHSPPPLTDVSDDDAADETRRRAVHWSPSTLDSPPPLLPTPAVEGDAAASSASASDEASPAAAPPASRRPAREDREDRRPEDVSSSVRRRPRLRDHRAPTFFAGQWVDVEDTVHQWLEATVMRVRSRRMLIHYNGWPARWDEWVAFDSHRVAPFRTRTLHAAHAPFASPSPLTAVDGAPATSWRRGAPTAPPTPTLTPPVAATTAPADADTPATPDAATTPDAAATQAAADTTPADAATPAPAVAAPPSPPRSQDDDVRVALVETRRVLERIVPLVELLADLGRDQVLAQERALAEALAAAEVGEQAPPGEAPAADGDDTPRAPHLPWAPWDARFAAAPGAAPSGGISAGALGPPGVGESEASARRAQLVRVARDTAPLLDRLGRVFSDLAPHVAALANPGARASSGGAAPRRERSAQTTPPLAPAAALAAATAALATARGERAEAEASAEADGPPGPLAPGPAPSSPDRASRRPQSPGAAPAPSAAAAAAAAEAAPRRPRRSSSGRYADAFRQLVATPARAPHLTSPASPGNIDIHIHAILTPLRPQPAPPGLAGALAAAAPPPPLADADAAATPATGLFDFATAAEDAAAPADAAAAAVAVRARLGARIRAAAAANSDVTLRPNGRATTRDAHATDAANAAADAVAAAAVAQAQVVATAGIVREDREDRAAAAAAPDAAVQGSESELGRLVASATSVFSYLFGARSETDGTQQ